MGWAVRDIATQAYRSWERWQAPAFDAETEELVELDEPPEISPAPASVPPTITRRQGRLWLLAQDLLDTVETLIDAAGAAAQIDYETPTWYRDSPLIDQLGTSLGKSSAEIDQFFRDAAAIA